MSNIWAIRYLSQKKHTFNRLFSVTGTLGQRRIVSYITVRIISDIARRD